MKKEGAVNHNKKNDEVVTLKLGGFSKLVKKVPFHRWAILSYVLIVALIVVLVMGSSFTMFNSNDKMKADIELFLNTQVIPDAGVTVTSLEYTSGIYIAKIDIEGQTVPTYFTKDGKFITQGIPLISINEPIEIPNELN